MLIPQILIDSEIITTVKNNKFNLNLNFSFLTNPFTNLDKENFSIKLIEFIIVSIFLFIFNMFQRKSEKGFYRVVLSQYRVSTVQKKE